MTKQTAGRARRSSLARGAGVSVAVEAVALLAPTLPSRPERRP